MDSTKSSAPPAGAIDSKSADISDSLATSALAALQSDVQPVGHDYVEEVGSISLNIATSVSEMFQSILFVSST